MLLVFVFRPKVANAPNLVDLVGVVAVLFVKGNA